MEKWEIDRIRMAWEIIKNELTYAEIGMNYEEFKKSMPRNTELYMYRLLEQAYKKELEYRDKCEKMSDEEIEEEIEKTKEEIEYLNIYDGIIHNVRVDYEKLRKNVPREQLDDFLNQTLNTHLDIRNKQHPCHFLIIDSDSYKDWDRISTEKRRRNVEKLIRKNEKKLFLYSKYLELKSMEGPNNLQSQNESTGLSEEEKSLPVEEGSNKQIVISTEQIGIITNDAPILDKQQANRVEHIEDRRKEDTRSDGN